MKAILDALSQGLDPEVRARLRECVDTMLRHLKFLHESDNANLTHLRMKGVGNDYLGTIFVLAAFSHTVVGPLSASGRETHLDLVKTVPILHGTQRFDRESAQQTRAMLAGFRALLAELAIRPNWLEVLHAEDIVYRVKKSMEPADDEQ